MVPALKLIVLVLSSFPSITNGHFQPKPTESFWIGDEIVVTGRRLVSSKSSKSSPTGNARTRRKRSSNRKGESKSEASQKGSDDSGTPRSKRDDSSRDVARSPSESASRPRSSTKKQSRTTSRSNKSRSSAIKRRSDTSESKRKKKKRSRSDPGGIFGGQSVPTLDDSLCDAKMRKCGRERRRWI